MSTKRAKMSFLGERAYSAGVCPKKIKYPHFSAADGRHPFRAQYASEIVSCGQCCRNWERWIIRGGFPKTQFYSAWVSHTDKDLCLILWQSPMSPAKLCGGRLHLLQDGGCSHTNASLCGMPELGDGKWDRIFSTERAATCRRKWSAGASGKGNETRAARGASGKTLCKGNHHAAEDYSSGSMQLFCSGYLPLSATFLFPQE